MPSIFELGEPTLPPRPNRRCPHLQVPKQGVADEGKNPSRPPADVSGAGQGDTQTWWNVRDGCVSGAEDKQSPAPVEEIRGVGGKVRPSRHSWGAGDKQSPAPANEIGMLVRNAREATPGAAETSSLRRWSRRYAGLRGKVRDGCVSGAEDKQSPAPVKEIRLYRDRTMNPPPQDLAGIAGGVSGAGSPERHQQSGAYRRRRALEEDDVFL
ncbi:hypothetical protein F4775DRAFT_591159 [Biscogniauxia sp. FL1348]|nr:hypothetical protein F4775DRAFT_591159 [Biscogniauxia sp. FL1348]